jgi:hypothetical protein
LLEENNQMANQATARQRLNTYLSMALGEYYLSYPPIFEVLHKIPQFERKILAIWAYKRFAHKKDLATYWTWDQARIDEFESSDEHKPVDAAVAAVRKEFSAIKSGYKLSGSAHPRPLSEQIHYWKIRESVGKSANSLVSKLDFELRGDEYTEDYAGYDKFCYLLAVRWAGGVIKEPTNAVPGLSSHGQMRAIDFHVKHEGKKVATSGGADNWRTSGFDDVLRKSVKQVNQKYGRTVFDGPLKSPDEPWHYTYIPVTSPESSADSD